MFDSIGWGEIVVLALAALFIFGPDRLPSLAKDAAAAMRRIREAIADVRGQADDNLGDDLGGGLREGLAGLRDLDVRRYHPKTILREHLLKDD